MWLLRVHAIQGTVAPGGSARRDPPRTGRSRGGARPARRPGGLDNRDSIISDLDDSSQVPWLEDNDISLYRGRGRIAGEMRGRVGDEELFASIAVVSAIGSEPTLPDVEGLSHANPWTNREATTSKIVPGRLLIIGGGVVGAEMAQAYTSLGAKVTVFQHGTQLLAKEEPWAAEQVAARLREQGAEIVSNAEVAKVERPGGTGDVTVQLQDGRSFTGGRAARRGRAAYRLRRARPRHHRDRAGQARLPGR
jgi:pyruvate/2-oxoglutarate dehydrogenase complex dihydrolipoamide dehydrogenase (E3) component